MSGTFKSIGQDISGAVNDVGTFFNRATNEGKIFSNPLTDIGIASAIALPFLAPEILPGVFGADAATAAAGAGAADLGAAAGAGGFDLATIGPGLAGTAFDTAGVGADVLPGAATLAEGTSPFAGAGTAFTMGGGGTVDPAVAAATGAPGGFAGSAADFATSFGQPATWDLTTGAADTGVTPLTGFEGAIPTPANPSAGGVFGLPGTPTPTAAGDPLSAIGNFLGSPAGKGATALAGLGGLGVNLYSGYEQKKQLDAINQQEKDTLQQAQNAQAATARAVGPLLNNGTLLTSYLTNNTLPSQFQSQIDQWVQSTKAAITQGYAARNPGGNVTPQNNSALQQDLANVDQQALGLKANFEEILSTAGQQMIQTANQLLSTGLNATALESEIPIAVAKLNQSINAQMSAAISNFAAAINGNQRTLNSGAGGSLTLNLNPSTGAIQ